MKYDLSILIPARNEEFLAKTVQDILDHKEGKTQIIIGLDGKWADPGVPDHPDVLIVKEPESVGQRAMTNNLCRLSKAKWVAKIDAHCTFDQGFDVKMMEAIAGHDDWTMVPEMRNLYAFDWVCPDGHRRFQSPSAPCSVCLSCGKETKDCGHQKSCGKQTTRDLVWKWNRRRPKNHSYKFDTTLHFQYFRDFGNRPEGQGDITETMSLQGSFFMMTRQKYWDLNICDERHGSWGQQGVEVALKTWLSGGKVMCNHKTWYAHLFRTQGGDFGFPYPQPPMAVEKAREYSRDLWFNNKYEKQIYPLSWLLEKFSPLVNEASEKKYLDWHDDNKQAKRKLEEIKKAGEEFYNRRPTKGIVYFTDNRPEQRIMEMCQKEMLKTNLPIVSVSLQPIDFGKNIHLPLERGWETYFKQILTALENSTADIVFFCEHDVVYPQSHFEFTPPTKDKFYYNQNWVKIDWPYTRGVAWDADQVSGLCCYRELALDWYRKKVEQFDKDTFDRKFEPGSGTAEAESWRSPDAYVDIRQEKAATKNKWSIADFRDKTTAKNFQECRCPEWAESIILNK